MLAQKLTRLAIEPLENKRLFSQFSIVPPSSIPVDLGSIFRLRTLIAGLLFFLAPVCHAAKESDALGELLKSPQAGVHAQLLFTDSVAENHGEGDPRWICDPAGTLERKGPDPFGNPTGAFGPMEGSSSGTAVMETRGSPLLASKEGAMVLLVKPGASSGMVISKGSWEGRRTFDIRFVEDGKFILYSGPPGGDPARFDLGSATPGEWHFLSLVWRSPGESGFELQVRVQSLAAGESLQTEIVTIPSMGGATSPSLWPGG